MRCSNNLDIPQTKLVYFFSFLQNSNESLPKTIDQFHWNISTFFFKRFVSFRFFSPLLKQNSISVDFCKINDQHKKKMLSKDKTNIFHSYFIKGNAFRCSKSCASRQKKRKKEKKNMWLSYI